MRDILRQFQLSRKSNVTAIVLSLFAGTIFWFFNALNKNYSTNIKYPVHYLYDDTRYQAIDPPTKQILVNMSGVGWNLLRKTLGIKVEPLEILVEAPVETKKIAGVSLTSLISDQVDDLSLNYILTDTLHLNFDKKVNGKIGLQIDTSSIILEPNYYLTSDINLSVDSVELMGPQGILDSLGNVILLKIKDSEIDSDFEDDIQIQFPRQELFTRNPPTVNISFEVEEFVDTEVEVPLDFINFPEGITAADSSITLSMLAAEPFEDTISAKHFVVELDFLNLVENDSSLSPILKKFPERWVRMKKDTTRINLIFENE